MSLQRVVLEQLSVGHLWMLWPPHQVVWHLVSPRWLHWRSLGACLQPLLENLLVVKSEKKSGILTDTPVQAEVQATPEARTKKKSSVPCKRKLIMTKKKSKSQKQGIQSTRSQSITQVMLESCNIICIHLLELLLKLSIASHTQIWYYLHKISEGEQVCCWCCLGRGCWPHWFYTAWLL